MLQKDPHRTLGVVTERKERPWRLICSKPGIILGCWNWRRGETIKITYPGRWLVGLQGEAEGVGAPEKGMGEWSEAVGKDLGDALGMATEWKGRLQQVVCYKAGESWRVGIRGQKEEWRSPT